MRAGRRALNRTRYRATGRRAEKKQISVRMRLPLAARMCTIRFATPKTKKKTEIIKTRNRAGYVAQTGEKKTRQKKARKGFTRLSFPRRRKAHTRRRRRFAVCCFLRIFSVTAATHPAHTLGQKKKERQIKARASPPTSVHIYTRSIYVRFPVKHRLKSKQTPSPVLFSFVASLPRARRPARNPRRYTDTSSSSSLLFFFRNLHCTGYARFECIQYETPT